MGKSRRYIIDVDTPNLSFIQTSVDLKRLGIKNCMFFLKLYDPSLRGVDPYDPDLPEEMIFRIVQECIINPWYFLREVARIPDQGNPAGIPYQLNRANLASTWCFINGIDHYQVIPRQIGKTQSTIAIVDWSFLFGTTNSEFMFLNMSAEKSIENLQRLKDQRELLPKYLQMKFTIDDEGKEVRGTDNVKTLFNVNTNNRIVTKPQARSIEAAEKIGRGATQPIQYYDEFEFINFVKTIMEASGPAFNTASENAKRNGSMYGRIFTSTPGDLDSQSGQDAMIVVEQTCRWTEKFYDMPIDDVKEYVDTNSRNGIMYIEYQYQQLGKDEAWFHKVCKLLNNNPLKIKREIFLMRMRGSSLSPYAPEDLAAIEERKGTVIEELFITNIFKINLYEKLERNRIYFVGVDVANGYGEDNSAITIFDPYNLKPVGEFKSPNIGVKGLIQFIYILIKKHLPRSILAIERNANGEAVLDHLRETDIRANIYFDNSKDSVADGIDDKLDAEGFVKREAARRKLYGIWTGGKSRERMFSLLEGHINEHKDKFIGEYIIDDLMKLVRTSTGKIAAGPGFHDDNIMSFLMCLYLYYFGNNLHRFGFLRGQVPDENERNTGLTYEDAYQYLSETDKAFFEGASFASKEEFVIQNNIQRMIESRNKGLISEHEMKTTSQQAGNNTKRDQPRKQRQLDPYELRLRNEMIAAQRESESFNRSVNFTGMYENMDIDDDTGDYEASFDWMDGFND